MIIRPATDQDSMSLWGELQSDTIRAVVCEDQGEILAIAGLRYSKPIMCFSEIMPRLKRSPRMILRMARLVVGMIDNTRGDVYAMADPMEPTASRFLSYVGFEHVRGRVYKWPR